MARFIVDVIRKGQIIIDDMDDIEDITEYVEGSNPIDEVEWSDFLNIEKIISI